MPPPVIMFRVLLYFIVLASIVVFIGWMLKWVFGIEVRFLTKLAEWYRKKKQERYEKKFKSITKEK